MALYLGQLLLKLSIVVLFTLTLTLAEAHDGTLFTFLLRNCSDLLGGFYFVNDFHLSNLGLNVLGEEHAQTVVRIDSDTLADNFCISSVRTYLPVLIRLDNL